MSVLPPPPPPHGAWLIVGEAPSIRSRDRGLQIMPEAQAVKAKGAPLEAGAGKQDPLLQASRHSRGSRHPPLWLGEKAGGALPLIQGATPLGSFPLRDVVLLMGKSALGRGDLEQQTFPGEGECDFRIVHYTSRHSDGRVELWLCCHARSPLLLSFSMFVLPPPPPRPAPGAWPRDRGL